MLRKIIIYPIKTIAESASFVSLSFSNTGGGGLAGILAIVAAQASLRILHFNFSLDSMADVFVSEFHTTQRLIFCGRFMLSSAGLS